MIENLSLPILFEKIVVVALISKKDSEDYDRNTITYHLIWKKSSFRFNV